MTVRVGLVCPYSLSVPGGVQAQVLGMARELRRQGVEARVLGPCDGPPPAGFVTPLGNSLPTAANGSIAPLAPDPAAALRTVRALRDERFDVLHLHEPLAPGPTLTTLLVHPAPIVATFHAAGVSASYRVFHPALSRMLRWVDHRVAVSPDARRLAQDHLGGEYEILFNGVATTEIRAVPPQPTDRPAILFIGRHEQRKGLGVLLDAVARLDADLDCWVVGSGPDSEALRRRHGDDDRIVWLGRLAEADKIARMRGATIFCAPSLHGESFGIVLAEAMAAGTAVVASALDGYRNVATDGVDAVLVPPGDVDALADALAALLADPAERARLEAAGHRRADELSMHALVGRYVEIYQEVLSRSDQGVGA